MKRCHGGENGLVGHASAKSFSDLHCLPQVVDFQPFIPSRARSCFLDATLHNHHTAPVNHKREDRESQCKPQSTWSATDRCADCDRSNSHHPKAYPQYDL